MIRFVTLTALVSLVVCDCPAPDHTGSALFYDQCHKDVSHALQIKNVVIKNGQGHVVYPIELKDTLNLEMSLNNSQGQIDSIIADVDVEWWGKTWFSGCSWHDLPTFGLLHNIRECADCPIKSGVTDVKIKADLSNYATILSAVVGGGVYGLIIKITDGSHPHTELACLRIEGKVDK